MEDGHALSERGVGERVLIPPYVSTAPKHLVGRPPVLGRGLGPSTARLR